jgi:proteic killer suppression protein
MWGNDGHRPLHPVSGLGITNVLFLFYSPVLEESTGGQDSYVLRNRYDFRNHELTYLIATFADKRTAALFAGYPPRKGISARLAVEALAKMQQLHAATALIDLRSPPGNRLESLKGDRRGQFSIRVDRQWRLCFRWQDNDAYDVELVDYHD